MPDSVRGQIKHINIGNIMEIEAIHDQWHMNSLKNYYKGNSEKEEIK